MMAEWTRTQQRIEHALKAATDPCSAKLTVDAASDAMMDLLVEMGVLDDPTQPDLALCTVHGLSLCECFGPE